MFRMLRIFQLRRVRAHTVFIGLITSLWLSAPMAEDIGIDVVTSGLHHPWSFVFLPDGEILISERRGTLRRFSDGQLHTAYVSGMPDISQHGQGGLLGLAIHPDFQQNRWLYFAHTHKCKLGVALAVSRGKYQNGQLNAVERLYTARPAKLGKAHFGGRLVFADDGSLYVTHGDRGQRAHAQNPEDPIGALLRLSDRGTPLGESGQADWSPEIVSIGHRNIQGAALHPKTRQLWIHEHGPKGGDELNLPQAGKNYGWPIITHGREYSGFRVGKGMTDADGLEQPLYYWTPSIAPSGMAFYDHARFPAWQGKLFIGSLKYQLLAMLDLKENQVTQETRLLKKKLGRIRDVQQSPDGYLYVLTDSKQGRLVRLSAQ